MNAAFVISNFWPVWLGLFNFHCISCISVPFKRHINHASSCFGWQPFFFLEFSPYIDIYDKSVTLRQEKFKLEKFTLTLMSLESNSSNLNNAFQYIPILLIANNNTHISPKGPRSFFYYTSKKIVNSSTNSNCK